MNKFAEKKPICVPLLAFFILLFCAAAAKAERLAPCDIAASQDGKHLFVAAGQSRKILRIDTEKSAVSKSFGLPAQPTSLAISPDGSRLAVTCVGAPGPVVLLNSDTGAVVTRLKAGHTPMAPVFSPDGRTVYVCNRFNDDVSVLDLATGKELARIPVRREPVAASLSLDGRRLLVANHLHNGKATAAHVAAVISVIDTSSYKVIDDLWLPNGSGLINDISVSPDGKYAVASHALARYTLPTTQLERGWMMTNAKTLIDMQRMEVINTVLVDSIDRGAANPWGVAWSADSSKVIVTIAGSHEVSVTKVPELAAKLASLLPPPAPGFIFAAPYSGPASRAASDVPNDLSFIHEIRDRCPLPEGDLGPRSVAVIGNTAWVANYFSDTLSVVDLSNPKAKIKTVPLGPRPTLKGADYGELCFNDARLCFQQWQSCASCHPGNGRVDGLNWDLLNDGIGNPKNNKSLLLAFQTPPSMSVGVREDATAAVRAGVRHILFTEQPAEITEALDAYIQSLKPVPSPYLEKGRLSRAAARGKKVFHDKEVGCAKCHPGPLFTDMKPYNVGTASGTGMDKPELDTPTLVELWRTSPYLHDGSATLREVLVDANKDDQHGRTSHLTADQITDLLQYLLSL